MFMARIMLMVSQVYMYLISRLIKVYALSVCQSYRNKMVKKYENDK